MVNSQGALGLTFRSSSPALRSAATPKAPAFSRAPFFAALRFSVACVLLIAVAGCRFTVDPLEISLTGNAGAQTTETLTVTNTGDEPLSYTLTSSGAGIDLSSQSGTLSIGESAEISVSMTCGASGEVKVQGTNSEGAASVGVPVSLHCPMQGDTRLVSLEVFQGPPVYKKDFETGEEFGRVPMALPEDGSPPKDTLLDRNPFDPDIWDERRRRRHAAWSPHDDGFVTAIWRRQAAVALAVRHSDDSPTPKTSAVIERDGVRTVLPETYRETGRDGDGFITDTVFYVERELYDRGAELVVSVDSDSGETTERLDLFGEEVPLLKVTWVPVVLDDVPEEEPIDPEEWTGNGLLASLPIGDYETGKGPTMLYEKSEEDEASSPPTLDAYRLMDQVVDHRMLHACARDEIYVGVFNAAAIREAGYSRWPSALASVYLMTAIMGGVWSPEAFSSNRHNYRNLFSTAAHEVGHIFGLGHAPCGDPPGVEEDYPYEDAILGPARSWDFLDNRFVGRLGERGVEVPADYLETPPGREYVDLMSYCFTPDALSDYHYQRSLLQRQSPGYWDAILNEDYNEVQCEPVASSGTIVAKAARAEQAPASLAITGSVDADGIATVRMIKPTSNPAWPAPPSGDLVLVVLDAGGLELHRQPVRLSPISHGDGRMGWSARVPYFEGAATVVLRGPDTGDVQAVGEIRHRAIR